MLNKFLIWIAEMALSWAYSRIKKVVTHEINEAKENKEAEVTDAKNVPAYQNATDRLEKIKAAESLLNGTRT